MEKQKTSRPSAKSSGPSTRATTTLERKNRQLENATRQLEERMKSLKQRTNNNVPSAGTRTMGSRTRSLPKVERRAKKDNDDYGYYFLPSSNVVRACAFRIFFGGPLCLWALLFAPRRGKDF